jgi:SanA protein
MKRLLKFFRRAFKIGSLCSIALFIIIVICDQLVERNAKGKTFNSVQSIPKSETGLVLGTSKYLGNGRINLYYKYRIDAAARLYHSSKVKYLLVSGDNSTKSYDEPTTMKQDLIEAGVPESKIYLDYAGFRTLDSMVRAKAIFGQEELTVISQQFHNERAIYIAESQDIKAYGYNAKGVSLKYRIRLIIRERLARVKLVLDLLFGVEPKFYGEPIQIG